MKIKNEEVKDLILSTSLRGTGKSQLLREGVKNYDRPFLLVCRSVEEGKNLTDKNPNATYVTPRAMKNLRGSNSRIIFDQEMVLEYLMSLDEL